MKHAIHMGISPCPNDTFVFHALLEDKVATEGLVFQIELADVEQLNERLVAGEFDVAKGSFYAALGLSSELLVLPIGAALGFENGPVLLGARTSAPRARVNAADALPDEALILCPGRFTTAHLLLQIFHPGQGRVEHAVFSDIIPRLEQGTADFGVCIHEARFTWRERGLVRVEDLGASFAARTRSPSAPRGVPLPLGGIFARRALAPDVLERIVRAIRASLDYARAHCEEALATMRAHAQEFSDDVLWSHVDLYVNRWTRELGPQGRLALSTLAELARERELCSPNSAPLEIFAPRP